MMLAIRVEDEGVGVEGGADGPCRGRGGDAKDFVMGGGGSGCGWAHVGYKWHPAVSLNTQYAEILNPRPKIEANIAYEVGNPTNIVVYAAEIAPQEKGGF